MEVPYPVTLVIAAGSVVIGRHKVRGIDKDIAAKVRDVVIVGKQNDFVLQKWIGTMVGVIANVETLEDAGEMAARLTHGGAVLWCNFGNLQIRFKE
jgi:hypothetical protein